MAAKIRKVEAKMPKPRAKEKIKARARDNFVSEEEQKMARGKDISGDRGWWQERADDRPDDVHSPASGGQACDFCQCYI